MSAVSLTTDATWISPYVFSCWVALQEKGVAFALRTIDLDRGEQRGPGYAALSLTARVPVLEHDGLAVSESLAILEYLEEAFPAPAHARVLPADVRARARARQLLSWMRSDDTAPVRGARSTHTMFLDEPAAPLDAPARAAVEKLIGIAGRVIADAGGGPLFEGRFGVVDADLAFLLHRLLMNGDAVPAPIRAWAEVTWTRPSIASFLERGRAERGKRG